MPTASPACRRSGTPGSPAMPLAEAGIEHGYRLRLAACAADHWMWSATGRCAGRACGPGGWAFQYANPHYPDVDDTAVVGMLLHRNGDPALRSVDRSCPRVDRRHAVLGRRLGRVRAGEHASVSQQYSVRRSWRAAGPADRRCYGALRVVPRTDRHGGGRSGDGAGARISAARAGGRRKLVRSLGHQLHLRHMVGAVRVQRGRHCRDDPAVRRAVAWLVSVQRDDGGWGEDEETYRDAPPGRYKESTPSQTAWAVLGLMAAGEVEHPAVARGIDYLVATQRADGEWTELPYTRSVFRAYSTCATTAIGCISRCWRWRAIATCGEATRAVWHLVCDIARSVIAGLNPAIPRRCGDGRVKPRP